MRTTPLMREMRELREKSGLTQIAFGKRIGVSGNQVSRIEKGRSKVSLAVLKMARLVAEGKA